MRPLLGYAMGRHVVPFYFTQEEAVVAHGTRSPETAQFSIGYFSLTASQAPLFLKFGPSPEIDFFDVSDDFEQKNKYYLWYLWTWKN